MEIVRATTLAEALEARAAVPGCDVLAGGTDLMVAVNFRHRRPENVVSLRRVRELADWDSGRIGAGVTWSRLERAPWRALAQAARTVGSPQIRNAGTVGGNIGTASPAGDGLPYLAARDAAIEVFSAARGRRILPWDEFFIGVKETALAPDELITAAVLSGPEPAREEFAKVGIRNAMVIATVAACVIRMPDDTWRIALGSVGPTPLRARAAEELLAGTPRPGDGLLGEVARVVSAEVRPITDHRATAEYRRHAAGVLARRLVARCAA